MVATPFALDAPTLPRRATLAEWLAEPQERGADGLDVGNLFTEPDDAEGAPQR